MTKYKTPLLLTSMIVVFSFAFLPVDRVQAQLITNEQVDEQKREVMVHIVDTLEAHLRLLQMVMIQRLEAQVAHLENLAKNQ